MHELSLAEGIRDIVVEAATAEGGRPVRRIIVEIGELAAVEPEALLFCLDAVLHDSLAAGAAVTIDTVPGAGRCPACAQTVALPERYLPCPACGHYGVEPVAGTTMRVKAIELDAGDAASPKDDEGAC